jgi:hypothetical protein
MNIVDEIKNKMNTGNSFCLQVEISRVVTPCSDLGYRCFGGPSCLHIQGQVEAEAARSFETSVLYHIIIQRHNTKQWDLNLHRRKNLKYRIVYLLLENGVFTVFIPSEESTCLRTQFWWEYWDLRNKVKLDGSTCRATGFMRCSPELLISGRHGQGI